MSISYCRLESSHEQGGRCLLKLSSGKPGTKFHTSKVRQGKLGVV